MSINIPKGEILGHPTGLFLLFTTEMWERFSYYGMRAILVLTMVAGTEAANPGFGWTSAEALKLYGWYTGLVYLTPLFGGWLADNILGQRKAIIIGGGLMAAAQFTLAASVPGNLDLFYFGLFLLILGNGFFKPNISTMVGDLYKEGDNRRDGGFTIFYMGINVGAAIAPLVCATLGENPNYGWSFGYMSAGFGMILSVLIQIFWAPKYLGNLGVEPSAKRALQGADNRKKPLSAEEIDRLRVVWVLFVFVVLFWASFEQAGGLMTIYANDKTDRVIDMLNFEIPTGWFQSLNPIYIVILAPIFATIWNKLGSKNPNTPMKMVLGLMLTSIGFLFMVAAVFDQQANGLAAVWWLVLAYLFHTMGELCISPVGLSLVTKLAPLRLASLMMGVWFLINFFSNLLAGYIGAFAQEFGELSIFGGIAMANVCFALILWPLSKPLVTWMHGAESYHDADSVKNELETAAEAV